MKKTLIILLLAHMVMHADAQMVKWLVKPQYDTMSFIPGTRLIQADSLGIKIIMDAQCEVKARTDVNILPFREGVALETDGTYVQGIYDLDGNRYTPELEACSLPSNPFFSSEVLLVFHKGSYYTLNRDGSICGRYEARIMYPFFQGLSSAIILSNPSDISSRYGALLRKDGSHATLFWEGKPVKDSNVKFVSSINEQGKGIAVIKDKLYFLDVISMCLDPVLPNGTDKLKYQAALYDKNVATVEAEGENFIMKARFDKKRLLKLTFDKFMRLVSIWSDDLEYQCVAKVDVTEVNYESTIHAFVKDGIYGIANDGAELLPAQLDTVSTSFDNKIMACKGGKWGILYVDSLCVDEPFRIKINKGNDIAFRHWKFETVLRIDLDPSIPSHETRIEVDPASGLIIDKTSRLERDTESGNFIQYDCELRIPLSLPDFVTDLRYPLSISYDGLQYTTTILTRAWHYKYYNVDVDESETMVSSGDVSFIININGQRTTGDDDYPFEVEVETPDLSWQIEKLSETRYKCYLHGLHEGVNNLNICIIELNCPPSVFPFEVTYTMPVDSENEEEVVAEAVAIKKKEKSVSRGLSLPI